MIFKNLFRRKGRTFLTVFGISIGVFAIIILGALAEGIQSGYDSIITSSKADLVITQPDTIDLSMSGIDEDIQSKMEEMSEISAASGMVQGIVAADDMPYFFAFGYPTDSFILDRFRIVEGVSLDSREASKTKGKPAILGVSASEALNKTVGDSVKITTTTFRIIGLYETGSSFEDGGIVLPLDAAQLLLGRANQVSAVYMQLKSPEFETRVIDRVSRLFPNSQITTTSDLADSQIIGDAMNIYVILIGGIAIVIGGVGMANSQMMAVFERTREIGVLRAVGWSRFQIMKLIMGESILVSFMGGLLGVGLGYFALTGPLQKSLSAFGVGAESFGSALLAKSLATVFIMGLAGGFYPAWKASKLKPVEALSYEGGGNQKTKRLPFGGMTLQSLWQRSSRTLMTIGMISITISSIMALEAFIDSAMDMMTNMAIGSGSEIMLRQANVADTSQSVIDVSITSRISALPAISSASGFIFSAVTMPDIGFFIVQGMEINNFGIKRYKIVEGFPLSTNHQIILGKGASEALDKHPGDTIILGSSRFKIVGVYNSGVGFENMGGIVTLRDGQIIAGRPRKVTMANVKVEDPNQAEEIVAFLNTNFPDVHASLSGDFAEQLPDMQVTNEMLGATSVMAILVGGIGIMNTMLMAVLERTREIGTLRALGWKKSKVLKMILEEGLVLGIAGGILGVLLAHLIVFAISNAPIAGDMLKPTISLITHVRAFSLSFLLGVIGGIYPAIRATRMRPIEALRYE